MSERTARLAVSLCAVLMTFSARAESPINSVGLIGADSTKKFSGMRQFGVWLSHDVDDPSDRFWMPSTLDFSAGWLGRGNDSAAYVSFGPSYRLPFGKAEQKNWFVDLGVHPTIISESRFEGKDLGGHFHFTSFLGFGTHLDQRQSMSLLLRYQHTSNSGLSSDNPGIDMVALTFSYTPGRGLDRLLADNESAD